MAEFQDCMATIVACRRERVNILRSVMLSPRGQSGLEAKILASASASASKLWPRPGVDFVVLLCNRVFFVQKSSKIREFC